MSAPLRNVRYIDQTGGLTDAGYQMLIRLQNPPPPVIPDYLTIEPRTSDPAAPVTGQIWLRTDL